MRSSGFFSSRIVPLATSAMISWRAVVSGDAEQGLMATGMVAGRLADLPSCADLLKTIETEARDRIAALCAKD